MKTILRSNDGLTLAILKKELPAIFATAPKPTVSDRYRFISTGKVLERMLQEGYYPVEAQQNKPRITDNEPFVRHSLRLRLKGQEAKVLNELVPELVLTNGHDGSACYVITFGFFRLVCLNGLVVGSAMASMRVTHSGAEKTIQEVLEASQKVITHTKEITTLVKHARTVPVTPKQALAYATRATTMRWKSTVPTLRPEQLLIPARPADEPNNVWTLFNTVQENLCHREHSGISAHTARRTRVQPVYAVKAKFDLNRELWNAAMELAA